MSRWHRLNPEKGNQVEPDSSASLFMEADAIRKGELAVCPNCGQWQRGGDCFNECRKRGFA